MSDFEAWKSGYIAGGTSKWGAGNCWDYMDHGECVICAGFKHPKLLIERRDNGVKVTFPYVERWKVAVKLAGARWDPSAKAWWFYDHSWNGQVDVVSVPHVVGILCQSQVIKLKHISTSNDTVQKMISKEAMMVQAVEEYEASATPCTPASTGLSMYTERLCLHLTRATFFRM
eukprot:CAMPEP_0182883020 /NCGR_PEP_ID=MMETSP0034_2-20130328/18136_1 /TAXON_ID=156128 /ORGANISM="Nephroselmis pyriformis, Strain CCMP717" /LENGTH=172 /DNA_ID=CAMNT_0025016141 /DNA_START=7 /DNA_END=522 /DNA_ORIENTATION=-